MSQADSANPSLAVYDKMQPLLPELRKRSGLQVDRRYLAHRATLANAAPTKEVQ